MDDQEERVGSSAERQDDALADARDAVNGRAGEAFDRRIDGAEHEGLEQPDSLEPAAATCAVSASM